MTSTERTHVNISEAAALLGVSRVTIWRWIQAGRLPVTRLGHRTARIDVAALNNLLPQPAVTAKHTASSTAFDIDDLTTMAGDAPVNWDTVVPGDHLVQFYEDDVFLIDAVAQYIIAGLRIGEVGLVIATHEHRIALTAVLAATGYDVRSLAASGTYIEFDADDALAQFMVDGVPDSARFLTSVGKAIATATADGRGVRAFGEMVAILAVEGNPSGALQLEELWNDLQREHNFALFCAYPMNQLGGEVLADLLRDICDAHSRVIPAESYSSLVTDDARLRAVIELQQKARWLEQEIVQRQRIEGQLREALAAERAAREETEAALRVRDEFLSIAAHELKTPLTGLTGHAQFLLRQHRRDGAIDPGRMVSALETIAAQANKLTRLVDELMDVSRLEMGKLRLDRQPTDLPALVRQIVDGTLVDAIRHPVILTLPETLVADVDPLRFEQVLSNLLDNAVKFSPDGGQIDVVLTEQAGDVVELRIRDRGVGIPEALRESIFDRFCQAPQIKNVATDGLGLGLSIARQIVELHGGTIHAESPPEGGACFVIQFPASLAFSATSSAAD